MPVGPSVAACTHSNILPALLRLLVIGSVTDSGKGCRSPGYEEFNPSSWPSECAPDKEDWIAVTSHPCNSVDREWGNIFWNCADITLTSGEKLAFVCFRVRLKHAIPYHIKVELYTSGV